MKRSVRAGGRRFEVELGARSPSARATSPAFSPLSRMAIDPSALHQLRGLLASAGDLSVHRLSDAEVIARLEQLVRQGRVTIVETRAQKASETDLSADVAASPDEWENALGPSEEKTWIEIELLGEDGKGIASEKYRVELPDGSVREGALDSRGFARVDGIDPGTCSVTFPALDKDAWAPA